LIWIGASWQSRLEPGKPQWLFTKAVTEVVTGVLTVAVMMAVIVAVMGHCNNVGRKFVSGVALLVSMGAVLQLVRENPTSQQTSANQKLQESYSQ